MAKLRRFGGTPVAEGVRLEVGKYTVFAVRNADKDISVRMRREPRVILRTLMRIPLLRGAVRMLRDIHRFFDGLSESSELQPQQVVRGTSFERKVAQLLGVHPQRVVAWIDALLLLLIAALCLFAAPLGAEAFLLKYAGLPRAAVNGIVCALRILGFLLAIYLFATVRERVQFADYPKSFEGFPIALITAGLMALAFMGFSGLQVWPM